MLPALFQRWPTAGAESKIKETKELCQTAVAAATKWNLSFGRVRKTTHNPTSSEDKHTGARSPAVCSFVLRVYMFNVLPGSMPRANAKPLLTATPAYFPI